MMRRYLILTTVDVLARGNNREHQMIAHLAPRFDETWIVYRRRCPHGGFRQVIRDALVPSARVIERDGVTFVEVNPLLNHFEGMAGETTGYDELDQRAGPRRWLRKLLFMTVSGFGIFKDVSTILFLAFFAWRRCPKRFEVATALGPWAAIAGIALRRLNRVGCLIYEDRDYEPGFIRTPLRRRWTGWLERVGIRRSDRVIAIGGRLASLRRQQTGRPIELVPTGVDAARFACPARPAPRPVLIYAGNMAPWSGLDLIVEALPRIRLAIPDVSCVFVGSGLPSFRARLEQTADRLAVRDCIRLTGEVPYDQVQKHLSEGAIGLALFRPSELRRFAAPLKVLEYMAAGLPTIATEQSEAADLVIGNDCGIATAFDITAFTHAVVDLFQDPERYQRWAANGRQAAVKYDWSSLMAIEYGLIHDACRKRLQKPDRQP